MSKPDRQHAEVLFQQTAELAPRDRASLLDAECGNDLALRAEVESLLEEFDAGPASFLILTGNGKALAPGDFTSGQMIGGKFKLLKILGEGGLGVVWLAEQAAPVRRKVALKVVKLGMDSKQVLTRFEAERNALTLMDHQNIARVLDAGMTETGQPFFAMEYVEGLPITGFCDHERLTIPQRLHLFIDVCHAVQHAHQKGVIHRDLKPSNILVMLHEGRPIAKVIDFGIAKATAQPLTEATLYTEQGQMIGTPEYMSPEQAEMTGVGVDSTTDIYSLGVVLYELVTGVLPFEPTLLRSHGLAEISRFLREVEARKPSTRISTIEGGTSTIAQALGTDQRTLCSQLKGDLDWIVMKALEKQRTRRYASASELAAEIERHLNHQPVMAGPPSFGYLLSKFVRRNRALVTFAAILMLTLVGGVVVTTLAWAEARAQRDRAETDRAAAELESEKANAVGEFVLYGLGFANPKGSAARELTVREMLELAERDIGRRFAGQPMAEVAIRQMLATTFVEQDEFGAALEQYELAIALVERERGKNDINLFSLLTGKSLTMIEAAVDRQLRTEPRQRAHRIVVAHLRSETPELADALERLADSVLAEAKPDKADVLNNLEEVKRQWTAVGERSIHVVDGFLIAALGHLGTHLANFHGMPERHAFFRTALDRLDEYEGYERRKLLLLWVLARSSDAGHLDAARRFVQLGRKYYPESHWLLAEGTLRLRQLLIEAGLQEEAAQYPFEPNLAHMVQSRGFEYGRAENWLARIVADGERAGDGEQVRSAREAYSRGMLPELKSFVERSDDAAVLEGRARAIARKPWYSAEVFDLALRAVTKAQELDPAGRFALTRGRVECRAGEYRAAIETLTPLTKRDGRVGNYALAFLAMAQASLGEIEQAKRTLDDLRPRTASLNATKWERRWQDEAERLVDPSK